MQLFKSRMTKR